MKNSEYSSTSFGRVNDFIYLAPRHHMMIMAYLTEIKGMSWEDLVLARQSWGWVWDAEYDSELVDEVEEELWIRFTSDAAIMSDESVHQETKAALEKFYDMPIKDTGERYDVSGELAEYSDEFEEWEEEGVKYAPRYEQDYGESGYYRQEDRLLVSQVLTLDLNGNIIDKYNGRKISYFMLDNNNKLYFSDDGHVALALTLAGVSEQNFDLKVQSSNADSLLILYREAVDVMKNAKIWGTVTNVKRNKFEVSFGSTIFPNKESSKAKQEVVNQLTLMGYKLAFI